VFATWEQEGVFAKVKLGGHGQIEWPGDLELCPDALYLKLTGKRPEDIFTVPGPTGSDLGALVRVDGPNQKGGR
jgi:hypothetical protein